MRRNLVQAIAVVLLVLIVPAVCRADSAQVLPKGVTSVDVTYYHYLDITRRYNPDGGTEDIAVDFNGNLNSNVFPGLRALDPLVGGNASIGRSVVDFTLSYRWTEITLSYGLTDNLSLGVLIPVLYSKNTVNARVDATTANVGKNPAINSLAPLAVPGTTRLTTEDVQQLLGRGLDITGDGTIDIPGFGYKRIETWSKTGIGDIEVSGKYQWYNRAPWRLAITGGVRLPTGRVDDPDNLVDLPFGDGQTDILSRFHLDYLGVPQLLLNLTLRYDIQLPDSEERRVSNSVNQPVTANKEEVDRDLGDVLEVEVLGSYALTRVLSLGAKYRFSRKVFQDAIDGKQALAYTSLEEETDFTSHMMFVTLDVSTVPLYQEKKFPVPFTFSVAYRNRFAGTNNVTDSEFISINLRGFF